MAPVTRFSWAQFCRRRLAVPGHHGGWALWLGPFAVGIGVAGGWNEALPLLFALGLAAFMVWQPAVIVVKALAGRRSRADVMPALIWMLAYSSLIAAGSLALTRAGHATVLWFGAPALPVLGWHLALVARRAERDHMGADIVGAGVLALAAPAAHAVVIGQITGTAWMLWALCWFQSAAAVVFVFLRLAQRRLSEIPETSVRWRTGRRAMLYHGFNVIGSLALALLGFAPRLTVVPFAAMWVYAVYGVLRPAVGVRPTRLGFAQVGATVVFSVLLITAYRLA